MENDLCLKKKQLLIAKLNENQILNKVLTNDCSHLTQDDIEKIRNFYSTKLEEINKLKELNEYKNISNLVESTLKKNQTMEVDIYNFESKLKSQELDMQKLKIDNEDINKKLMGKEKYGKMLVDKINLINNEKQNIINEESEKRNELVKDTENFVRSLQNKYEDELPEKKRLIEENSQLRSEIEECIKNSANLKEILENRLKEKEKITESMENKLKFNLTNKMQEMTLNAQKYIFENSELKMQIANHHKKKEELMELVKAFNKEYDKLIKEVEKVSLIYIFFLLFIKLLIPNI